MSINQWVGCGRLGQDPVSVKVKDSTAVNFSLAVDDSWWNPVTKEMVKRVQWIQCAAWGKIGESIAKYMTKGREVIVQGKMETQTWEVNGQKRSKTQCHVEHIKFLWEKTDWKIKSAEKAAKDKEFEDAPPPMEEEFNEEVPF